MIELQFLQLYADEGVYKQYTYGNTATYIVVYVDDLLLFCNNLSHLQDIKQQLSDTFTMTDMGEVTSYLSIRIRRDRRRKCIYLDQTQYIEDMLKKFGIENCAPIGTPMDVNVRLSKEMCPQTQDEVEEMANIPYQSAVGSLMYLMLATRPDITYAIGVVSKFNSNYGRQHWQAIKRIFHYLQYTKEYCLNYGPKDTFVRYSDAD